jgi:fucose permease
MRIHANIIIVATSLISIADRGILAQASSLLIMAILGDALLPPLQGLVADKMGIQFSFVVPMFAVAYIAFYGLYGYRAGKEKNAVITDEGTPVPSIITLAETLL